MPARAEPSQRHAGDLPETQLDDEADRDELRQRYYNLEQELRVLLPGVQVLVAFLLTAPFASRFDQLDDAGRGLYVVALLSGLLAVVLFLTPTAYHRLGRRQARSRRLRTGIAATRAGLGLLAVSLLAAATVILRFLYETGVAVAVVVVVAIAMLVLWVLLPLQSRRWVARMQLTRNDG